jgi:hypothetical protein
MLTGPPPKFHGARDIFELLLGQPWSARSALVRLQRGWS